LRMVTHLDYTYENHLTVIQYLKDFIGT
jgi:hypothetical protein